MRDESEESSPATNSRKEREALEAIAKRKKYEKQQLKQALCAEQDRRKAEEDYLKRLMAKAMKKPEAPQSGVILHRTRSQKRRALYRKYRNRETLLPDEQMQLKKDREKSKDKSAQMKCSYKGKRLYPYGNFPPRFQKTPAAGSRFYWGPDGPDLRNDSNKDKPNVFHRPSEQILSSVREDGVASTVFESEDSSDTPGKRAERVKNKQLAGKGQPISKAFLNVHGGKEPPKIGHIAESHSSSPTRNTKRDNAAPVAFSIARSKYGSSMTDRQKETSSEPTNASQSDLTSATAENPRYKQRKKQKIRCAPKDIPKDSILADHETENMTAEVFETFIEAREKLMRLREKAWQQSLRRAERKKAERMDRIKADMAERETRLRKVIHPEIEKVDMKRTSHLSIPSLPAKHPDKDRDSSRGYAGTKASRRTH
ncbi:hypothetical protein RvY_01366-1 [Ramazzottius varieornatus]|uniref:Uncharacterized protein n=1 Tax=Ramazzottius varieornatus TaxID=947166 RepID=A0A1D1UGF3_RAMVA|nr:hypothetical protein RvY_01366-1 [Ramazzottius varieornatus]